MSPQHHTNARVADPRTYNLPPCQAPTSDSSNGSSLSPPRHHHNHGHYHHHQSRPRIADIPSFLGGDQSYGYVK